MYVGSSSLTTDQTRAPCIGSSESQPLRHQGSPLFHLLELLHMLSFALLGPKRKKKEKKKENKSNSQGQRILFKIKRNWKAKGEYLFLFLKFS